MLYYEKINNIMFMSEWLLNEDGFRYYENHITFSLVGNVCL